MNSPDPGILLRFLAAERVPLPLLLLALKQILWRYPHVDSGGNRYESVLLANVREHGPRAAHIFGASLKGMRLTNHTLPKTGGCLTVLTATQPESVYRRVQGGENDRRPAVLP